ncbi:MAG: manganese efflux pump MntP family protein [Bacillota bacterium]|nr:manganese efflux pump MntP family protein [Bacillota bacterium]
MGIISLFFIALGLAMDAFAVSICKGLSMDRIKIKNAVVIGLYFGIFQAGMPVIGYLLGVQFQSKITAIDHWIAFILLGLIGFNMIREALSKEEEEANDSVDFHTMIVLAIATSIDALAVGITFAFLGTNIVAAATIIGCVTFVTSLIGVKIGNLFGSRYKSKAEFIGGLILILLGTKILLEHLEILP